MPSVFAIAANETKHEPDLPEPVDFAAIFDKTPLHMARNAAATAPAQPHLIVMPREGASRLNNHNAVFKDLIGAPLPLYVVRNVARIQTQLHAEFPHATGAVGLLMRDLREGKPLKIRPTILCGPPGSGKSRIVRRLSALAAGAFVMRYDAASASDGQFGGTSKGWSNTEASVPARAVLHSKAANPVVMVDEIEKSAGAGSQNGNLHSSLLGFIDDETSSKYRDVSLDCEMNLASISYLCTANSTVGLPPRCGIASGSSKCLRRI